MNIVPNIKIFVRPVDWTAGLAQHIYIVGTKSKGEQTILRAGPERTGLDSMITDNLKAVYVSYKAENKDLFPGDWDPEHFIEVYTLTGTDAEIQAKMDTMWEIGKQVNSGNYDYKVPLPIRNVPNTVWHVQNSNTVGNLMAKSIGVDLKPLLLAKKLWAPGIDGHLDHTITDQIIKAHREHNSKYGEYTQESFKQAGLTSIMEHNKEQAEQFIAERETSCTQEYTDFENLMQNLNLDWDTIFAEYNKVDISTIPLSSEYGLEKIGAKTMQDEPIINLEEKLVPKEDVLINDIKVVELGSTRVSMLTLKYLANGNIAIMWSTHTDISGMDRETYLQIHDQYGTQLEEPLNVSIQNYHMQLEALSNSNLVIYTLDILNILSPEGNLLNIIKLDNIRNDAYIKSLRAMPDGKFLFTWHEHVLGDPEHSTSIFKGKYYDNSGNVLSDEFIIYHGNGPNCKISNVENNTIGIICRDHGHADINKAGIDNLACTNNSPKEEVNCFAILSTINATKSGWIKLPPSRTFDAPDILNFGDNNFVVAIEQPSRKVYIAIIKGEDTLTVTEIPNLISKKNEIHLTKTGCDQFLVSFQDKLSIVAQKFNIRGETLDGMIYITDKTKASNHHHTSHFSSSGYVVSWMHTEHNTLPEWHHFEYGYSGAWQHFKDITTSIYMDIHHINPNPIHYDDSLE
ncbi:hypothetical protein NOVO_02235 [Rickettsiales bacterium Ac37b]|nr:hypothetical protein NOVO_02235 [Rickettsiales bacterium Ac37b]